MSRTLFDLTEIFPLEGGKEKTIRVVMLAVPNGSGCDVDVSVNMTLVAIQRHTNQQLDQVSKHEVIPLKIPCDDASAELVVGFLKKRKEDRDKKRAMLIEIVNLV